ncbi:uncharacterized protein LOC105156015 [Sesamum indicum]|uniref:Uncharacterized protein LOC105156015 n=1 Tax=Sesamum indicum TaxID=4182 RepID=A0A6I9SKC9_SESIN|nr:uncharacterized protein LOC105156015 [Sesamum indicum]
MADLEPFSIPDGWKLVKRVDNKGTIVKYYTNVLGQKFYSKEDLLRNIKDAKEKGLSIYGPEFKASDSRGKKKKTKIGETSTRICKRDEQKSTCTRGVKISRKQGEAKKGHEIKGGRSAVHICDQTVATDERRRSRRLAGLEPELKCDFKLDKALEYVVKD